MRRIFPLLVLGAWLVPGALPTAADDAGARPGPTVAAQNQASTSSGAMTNDDVVRMVKAGLSEDIIISAIQAAKERQFTLTPDGLIQLKTNGVPDRVVAAMLNPAAAGGAAPGSGAGAGTGTAPPPTPTLGGAPTTAPLPVAEVSLVSSTGTQAIMPEGGDISQTFAVIRTIVWANFRGLKSDARTADRRPSILIRTDEAKFDTRFMIVKADVDEDDNVRSVRMRSGVYSVSTAFQPDSSWIIATVATQEQPGTWRMTIHRDLDRGEYGVMDTQNRYLYGFAIDR
jgi:hypothetical protein